MSHPSSTIRGKALTLPILAAEDPIQLEHAVAQAMQHAAPDSHTLVTVSESPDAAPRVLTISSGEQRTVSQWKTIIAPAIASCGAVADWEKALVLLAEPDQPRHL